MKTIKELLIILQENVEFYMGTFECPSLCSVTWELYEKGEITYDETKVLEKYISNNKPHDFIHEYLDLPDVWGWPVGDVISRQEWIKERLKLEA